MTDNAHPDLAVAAAAAAAAAAEVLPSGGTLTPGAPTTAFDAAQMFGQAVTAPLSGATSGELLVLIGRQLATALTESPLGSLDVAAALAPTLQAAARSVGNGALGNSETADAASSVGRFVGAADALIVPLMDGVEVAAAIGVRLNAGTPQTEGFTPIINAVTAGDALNGIGSEISAQRLDLLRGVEMDVTAEIGRTKMTVAELLSLRDGYVVELDRPAGAPADLLVNGHLIARGEVVVIDENFGLRITEIVSDEAGR